MKKRLAILIIGLLFAPVAVATEANTPIESITRGMSVTLHGEVTRILDDDEFRLTDKTGSVRIYTGWKNRFPARVGERLTVRGVVDDDLDAYFRPEVYAFEIIREDGTAVKLHQD